MAVPTTSPAPSTIPPITAVDAATALPGVPSHSSAAGPAQPYPLRLGLSLLLDALLLDLGAAANSAADATPEAAAPNPLPPPADPPNGAAEDPPWRLWLAEDLDLALQLAIGCRMAEVELPVPLSPTGGPLPAPATLSGLSEHFAAAADEITRLLDCDRASEPGWQQGVERALGRVKARLAEVGSYRRHEPEQPRSARGGRITTRRVQPGEFLG